MCTVHHAVISGLCKILVQTLQSPTGDQYGKQVIASRILLLFYQGRAGALRLEMCVNHL